MVKVWINPFILFLFGVLTVWGSYKNPDIIIVGENHTDVYDHKRQLEVIKDISKTEKVIIAMEIFQQPFQNYLDEYIEGKLSEEQLIEKTEYKRRWGHSFEFYRDILRFAKENKIKIVALNIPTELLKEIREKGLENTKSPYIPAGKFDYLPSEIQFIKEALEGHKVKDEKVFFNIQKAWDIGMAYKIVKTKKEYPDYKVVVLIGKGHQEAVARFIKIIDKSLEVIVY
ncbi:MAG: ChaN family lipoprotein [Hydrogenothermaceae bacterium]